MREASGGRVFSGFCHTEGTAPSSRDLEATVLPSIQRCLPFLTHPRVPDYIYISVCGTCPHSV